MLRSFVFFIFVFASLCAFADNDSSSTTQAFVFNIENDSRMLGGPGSDDAYTSGVRFSYVYAENEIPTWSESLLQWSDSLWQQLKNSSTNIGLSLGQQIYTPNDIQNPNLNSNDRPYAAWLYVGLTLQFKNEVHSHVLEMDVGYIGPEAQGENAQNAIHHFFGYDTAQGWNHQLGSEPTLQFFYQQREKVLTDFLQSVDKYFDVIPYFGGSFGNVAIDAHIGGLVRFGNHLPNDFGPTGTSSKDGDSFILPTKSNSPSSIYLFGGGKVTAVARDIFLDGNTFHASDHVTKYPFVAETEFGLGCAFSSWEMTWRFVTRGPEFKEIRQSHSFASFSLSRSF